MNSIVRERKEILESELKRIVGIIVKKYAPEKIILFGSLANGAIHEWSDIDLAIVKKTHERFIQRLHDVSQMTLPVVGVNFIVYTPEEFQEMIAQKQYFMTEEILKKGKVVYEKYQ